MYISEPVAFVKNSREQATDDNWDEIISEINLTEIISAESIKGIIEFSHLEIIFYFHLVDSSEINFSAVHPRENKNFPEAGIFSQRKKSRPNLIGTTIVKLISAENKRLLVKGLDAVNGTPVLDIKPVYREFLPAEEIIQPQWVSEIMKDYWIKK